MTTQAKYTLTDEHRAQLKPWAERWIANALSTKAMDDADRAAMRVAITGLYEAAGLEPPPAHRIVFVPSPFVGNIAAGFAAAIWWLREHGEVKEAATRDATDDATAHATDDATVRATDDATVRTTDDATRAATADATDDATVRATVRATDDATLDATDDATRDATADATLTATADATLTATADATLTATADATADATDAATAAWAVALAKALSPRHHTFLLDCARSAWRMRNGGNHWSGWCALLSFFRHVVELDLPIYDKWQHYEAAAIHGSWRWMHPKFCIVSDRPKILALDAEHRPHCADGPSHEWRDGWKLYHWHGVRVPAHWIEGRPAAAEVLAERNIEVRRAGIEILGWARVLEELDARVIDADPDPMIGSLVEVNLPDLGRPQRFLLAQCGTGRKFAICVPPTTKSALAAQAWMVGLDEQQFRKPEMRT